MLPDLLDTEAHLVAPDTFIIPTLANDPSGLGVFGVNTLVIRGAEPVIVDTSASLVREHWLETVTSVVDPGRSISWRTIPTRLFRDSTIWTYVLEPNSGGCRITQHFEVVLLGKVMERVLYATVPAHRDRSLALADDVRHLGERAAQLVAA